jgi:DNA polymerase-4
MPRIIFHLDMDAFYAAIEQRDRPELRGRPVIVGSPPTQRGVVAAASYEARQYGVRSAMPSATAGRLCPQGVFVPPRMGRYQEESQQIMGMLAQTGAEIEPMSIDEAYLDVSAVIAARLAGGAEAAPPTGPDDNVPCCSSWGSAVALARELKARIRDERRLTATIGIAANKLLAKIASDFRKPDGLTLIPDRDKAPFLRPLPVRCLYGVGRVTEQTLHRAGLRTIGDVQDYRGDLRALVGSFGPKLREFACGVDDRCLELGEEVKSISSEETFLRDTDDRRVLRDSLQEQAAEIAAKLQRKRLGAHTVQVKVRYGDFTTLTRQLTVEEPIDNAGEVYRLGCYLLRRERLVCRPLRLIGLGVSGLTEATCRQLALFQA